MILLSRSLLTKGIQLIKLITKRVVFYLLYPRPCRLPIFWWQNGKAQSQLDQVTSLDSAIYSVIIDWMTGFRLTRNGGRYWDMASSTAVGALSFNVFRWAEHAHLQETNGWLITASTGAASVTSNKNRILLFLHYLAFNRISFLSFFLWSVFY